MGKRSPTKRSGKRGGKENKGGKRRKNRYRWKEEKR